MKTCNVAAMIIVLAFGASAFAADAKGSADEQFVQKAASGGMLEVKLGKLAAQNAQSADVKTFGEHMVTDHGKANDALLKLAKAKGIAISSDLMKEHQETYDSLKGLKGADFDRAYMKNMVKDHEEDVAEFAKFSKETKDEQLRAFADKVLPGLKAHLEMSRTVATKVGAATGR